MSLAQWRDRIWAELQITDQLLNNLQATLTQTAAIAPSRFPLLANLNDNSNLANYMRLKNVEKHKYKSFSEKKESDVEDDITIKNFGIGSYC